MFTVIHLTFISYFQCCVMLICVMLMLVHIRKESVYIYPSFFTSYILYFQVSYAFDVVTLIFRGADDE